MNEPTMPMRLGAKMEAQYEYELEGLRELVRRAVPFVNAIAVMAEDESKALQWLADASRAVASGQKRDTEEGR